MVPSVFANRIPDTLQRQIRALDPLKEHAPIKHQNAGNALIAIAGT
jgi:hypothetical protein